MKFKRGDIVQIAKDLGLSKSHFKSDCRAVILHSYGEAHGGGHTCVNDQYALAVEGLGWCAWYKASHLTKVGELPAIKGVSFPTERQLEKAAERYFKSTRSPALSKD